MDTEPRNIGGNYPLAGERIGPAWRSMWKLLSPEWQYGDDLAAIVAEETGLAVRTLRNLLRKAVNARLLETRSLGKPGLQRAEYRIRS